MSLPVRLFDRLTQRLGLERDEARRLLLMGALVASLMCGYTIAKVLRDAMFLFEFGALSLPYAYLGVAVASALFVWAEGRAVRRFTHVGAAHLNQFFAIAFSVFAAMAFPHAPHRMTALFYIWTGSQAMMLLPHFWVLALDLWDSRQARRVFPILGGCGLIGGLIGGAIAGGAVPRMTRDRLMWVLPVFLLISHVLSRWVEKHGAIQHSRVEASAASSRWDIIRRSRYIKIFAAGLALSVIVSTLVDFQFKLFIQQVYPDHDLLTRFLGKFYVALNAVSLLFQFGLAGWLIQRLGLTASTGLQPTSVLLFSLWLTLTTGWWVIVAMRWIQGVVFQTVGKASAEIYYTAILPIERRSIKPMIDTLVERWSDAACGLLLIVALHVFHVPMRVIVIGTAFLATIWLILIARLHHYFGLAFQDVLKSRWTEPEVAPETFRLPSARKALLEALQAGDERRVILALELAEGAHDAAIEQQVRLALKHPSPNVRAAAVQAMRAMRLPDPEGVIAPFLREPHEALRRAAVGYLLSRGQNPTEQARSLLDGDDVELRQYVLDELFQNPTLATGAVRLDWIDRLLESDRPEDLRAAARAIGAMPTRAPEDRLRALIEHPDVEVRRLALLSVARRPHRELLPILIRCLNDPALSYEARSAVAAIGNPAVDALQNMAVGASSPRVQSDAARTLAEIATPRAIQTLRSLARNGNARIRQIGLRGLARVRARIGRPVVPQREAHRFFLRELNDYRVSMEPAVLLRRHPAPEIRLLGDSYRESAEMDLERAIQALSCWYEAGPLFGVFHRLISGDPKAAAPALEYLGHVLPGSLFRVVVRLFETKGVESEEPAPAADRVIAILVAAWRSEDDWLRACAVRAARRLEGFDLGLFERRDDESPVVRAEIDALRDDRDRHPGRNPIAHSIVPLDAPAC